MLAELAAANAAYKVIKTAVQNGTEIAQLGKQISTWMAGEEVAREKLAKKRNSVFGTQQAQSDWEEFQFLENYRNQQKELESFCRLYGRPGMWNDWQQFQIKMRKQRSQAKKQRARKRRKMVEWILFGIFGSGLAAMIVVAVILIFNSVY